MRKNPPDGCQQASNPGSAHKKQLLYEALRFALDQFAQKFARIG